MRDGEASWTALLSVAWEGAPIIGARPVRAPPPGARREPGPGGRYVLSRFALIRREGREILVESPEAWARAFVHDRRLMPLLHDLGEPLSVEQARGRAAPLPEEVVPAVLGLLLRTGLVCWSAGDDEPTFAEDTEPDRVMWGFPDRLFHERSRSGGLEPLGKTYPFRDRFPPPPALGPRSPGPRVALSRPDLARLQRDDPPFAAVMEGRRSTRRPGAEPISLDALSELLFRTLRVREIFPPSAERPYASTSRPYPSAGACYPLEAYLAVARCEGLAPGLHHYLPEEHALRPVCGRTEGVDRLLRDAFHAAGAQAEPQILLILAARAARVAWSYGALSYSLILKDAGVVLQSVSLAAAAMGLAACALGVGNAHLFAEVVGADGHGETSVAEILLGSAP